MLRSHLFGAGILWGLLTAPGLAGQEESQDTTRARAGLGGPDQVERQLETDREPREALVTLGFMSSYFDFKENLRERTGFSFSLDYSSMFWRANESLGAKKASGGMVRFFGSWELVGRGTENSGALVFKVEHRHGYSSVTPFGFGFETGYVGLVSAPFSDQGLRWTNLYWRQRFAGRRAVFLAGFLDATDFLDVYGLASPWMHNTNLAFSTGSAATGLPNDAGLGIAGAVWLSDHVYTIASLVDNAADPTQPFDGFGRFFNTREYFSSIEIGWTTAQDRAYFDNVHLTLWHSDKKSEVGDPSGWGLNFSATTFLNDNLMPYVRAGYSEDAGSLLQKSLSTGIGYQAVPGRDLLGIGFNWGQPNETTWGEGLRDQYGIELFWRWWLGEQIAVTPDLQYILRPALNTEVDSMWYLGVRARLVL
jgi:porin